MTDLTDVNGRLIVIESNQGHMSRKIDDMHKVVVGNGDAEKGVISRLGNLCGQVKAIWVIIGLGATFFTGLVLTFIAYATKAH